jgi:anti-anti-sigma factor
MSSVNEVGRFELRTWPDRERVVLALHGELDVASVSPVRVALDELLAAGWRSVVLDLRELTFIDSTGVSLLLEAERAARCGVRDRRWLAGGRQAARGHGAQ